MGSLKITQQGGQNHKVTAQELLKMQARHYG
jgi:hypothetical protein